MHIVRRIYLGCKLKERVGRKGEEEGGGEKGKRGERGEWGNKRQVLYEEGMKEGERG